MSARKNTWQLRHYLTGSCMCTKPAVNMWCFFPGAWLYDSSKQRMGIGFSPIISSDQFYNLCFLPSAPHICRLYQVRHSRSQRKTPLSGDTEGFQWTWTWDFHLMLADHCLSGGFNWPEYHEELRFLLHNRGWKEYFWNTWNWLGALTEAFVPERTVNRQWW